MDKRANTWFRSLRNIGADRMLVRRLFNSETATMKMLLTAAMLILSSIAGPLAFLATSATLAQADEPRFDFSSRKAADASYARVFAQFSEAGGRALLKDVKKLLIVQFSPDGTVSGGRAAIKRKKPTADEYYAAMARALDGKTAAEVVAEAEKIRE